MNLSPYVLTRILTRILTLLDSDLFICESCQLVSYDMYLLLRTYLLHSLDSDLFLSRVN